MPSLQGYEVQTFQLPDEQLLDVLRKPGEPHTLWVPASHAAVLSGDGRRPHGIYSASDMGRTLDKEYRRREPDPRKIYTRTRTLSVTLFSVEGLIQKTCRSTKPKYAQFCREFMEHVLPNYEEFAAHHAELIMFWYEALDHFKVVCHGPSEAGFRAAKRARDDRLEKHDVMPFLVLGTVACEKILVSSREEEDVDLVKVPIEQGGPEPMTSQVARLHAFHGLADMYYKVEADRDWLPVAPQLIWMRRNSSATLPDGTLIVKAVPVTEQSSQAGLTADDVLSIVQKALAAHDKRDTSADLLADVAASLREQTKLMKKMVDLTLPEHQLFLPASDYNEGMVEVFKRAPKLKEPSFGLTYIQDAGKASLWMKRLCREEKKKVAKNADERLEADAKGLEEPPLYVAKYRMKLLTREHVKVLMFNPPCWAKLKQTFLPPDTPTVLFPGLKIKEA